jgi:hypothetical protein
LNITSQNIQEQQEKTYLNILGFTKAGQRFLKEKKEAPILTRIGKKEANEANLLIKSDQLYAMPKNRYRNKILAGYRFVIQKKTNNELLTKIPIKKASQKGYSQV